MNSKKQGDFYRTQDSENLVPNIASAKLFNTVSGDSEGEDKIARLVQPGTIIQKKNGRVVFSNGMPLNVETNSVSYLEGKIDPRETMSSDLKSLKGFSGVTKHTRI